MTAQTVDGFLLTRNWRDGAAGVELEFWFATDQGPLQVLVRGEHSVFFLRDSELASARKLLSAEPGIDFRKVSLRDFELQDVVGCYLPGYRQARRAADVLREHGLDPLESDINPADRFLMERFIAGAAGNQVDDTPEG